MELERELVNYGYGKRSAEDYSENIKGLLNKTILSQYDDNGEIVGDQDKKRFTGERELIDYLLDLLDLII